MTWFWRVLAVAGALAGFAGIALVFYTGPGEGLFIAVPLAGLLWSAVRTLRHPDELVPKIVLAILSVLTFASVAAGLYLMKRGLG
ncbi:MAG: hypothetical protein QM723_30495 [Myxococcaceae bacterium]